MIYELLASIIGIVGALIVIEEMKVEPKVDADDIKRTSSNGMTCLGIIMLIGAMAWLWNLIQ